MFIISCFNNFLLKALYPMKPSYPKNGTMVRKTNWYNSSKVELLEVKNKSIKVLVCCITLVNPLIYCFRQKDLVIC